MNNLNVIGIQDIPEEYVVIEIDARQAASMKELYDVLAQKLHFPDYFSPNLDSLDEVLNDLSWIENENLAIYFKNSPSFLINERSEDKVKQILNLLDGIAEDWKWMEPDPELSPDDDDYLPKKEIVFCFSRSERIENLIDNL